MHRPWTGGLREFVVGLWVTALIVAAAVAADRIWQRLVAGSGDRADSLDAGAHVLIAALAVALVARQALRLYQQARARQRGATGPTRPPPGPQGRDGPDFYDV